MDTPDSAHYLATASSALARDLALIDGQPGLTGIAAATDVVKHLAYVTEQLGLHLVLVAEFIRAESEAGRVVSHPGLEGEVDVARHKDLALASARTAVSALDTAARAADQMHELVQELATKDDLPERIGVDPALRSKGFAMNLLHAAVVTGDWDLVKELGSRLTGEEAANLIAVMQRTSRAITPGHSDTTE